MMDPSLPQSTQSTPPPPATLPPRTLTAPQIVALLHAAALSSPASSSAAPTLPSSPLVFLSQHLASLPPNLLSLFAEPITTPQERSSILLIRNRRLTFATSSPPPSSLSARRAKRRHPLLWERVFGPGPTIDSESDSDDEEAWAQEKGVMGGGAKIGRFGALLKGFEEEREGERVRGIKREERRAEEGEGEEFESESDEDETEGDGDGREGVGGTVEERIATFERLVRERFLNGLEDVDYDPIDLSETWDPPPSADRSEEMWFEDESPGVVDASMASASDGRTENGEGEYDY